tara:strand:- start:21056 stop:21346 length:291 start_codon:yes stop_codon:yes gene_type:complete
MANIASDDNSVGGNTFTMNADFTNSGSGYLRLGNGNFDTYSVNVTLKNTGSRHIYIAYNGSDHSVARDFNTSNSGTGTSGINIDSGNTSTYPLMVI